MEKMAITAQMVQELRKKTNVGMMDCKKALTEADGDMDAAIEILRTRGIAKAEDRAGRSAEEGLIASYIHAGSKLGVMIEVNSGGPKVSAMAAKGAASRISMQSEKVSPQTEE